MHALESSFGPAVPNTPSLVGCQLGVEDADVALGEHVENQLDDRLPSEV